MKDKGAILVVDDTPANLELLVDTLTAEGYQVLSAASGELALAAVAARPPELILLDILMPVLDGFEVCRRLKARPESCGIPVVLISVSGDRANRLKGLKLGAVDYITQPFEREELLARVQTHLELGRLRVQFEQQADNLRQANEQLQTELGEQKRVEEALRASQQIVEGIINAIPVRVFWKDKNLVYLGCNAVFARDAGFADPKDLIGKDDFQMGWRDQAELYRRDDRQVIESGCAKLLIEEPQTTPEGKTITLLSSKLPLRGSKGEVSGILGTYMNITERKQAEEMLRQRVKLQDQLVHIAATVPGMIYSLLLRPDGSTQMPYVSGAFSDIFDLQPKDIVEDAAPIFSMIHPNDLGHVRATMAESARTLNPWRDDFRVCHTRLGEIWVEGHSVPQREPDGSTLWHGFVQDITERKRAEEALRRTSELLLRTGELAKVGGWDLDLRSMKLFWSLETCRIHEVEPPVTPALDQAINFYAPEARPVIQAAVQAGMDCGTPFDLDLPLTTAKGRPIWVRAQGSAVMEDGKAVKLLGAFQDITERKRAEQTLREVELRLAHAMSLAQLVAWEYDVVSGFFTFSDRYYVLHGTTTALEGGNRMSAEVFVRRFVHPDDAHLVAEEVGKAVTTADPDYRAQLESRILRRDGELRHVLVHISITKDAAGRTIQLHGANQDITERKRAQAELENLHKQLLDASRQAGMAEVATNVLHNVGNVLNSVNISTTLIVQSVKKSRASSLARVVVLLQEHAHDLGEFITNDSRGKHLPAHLAQLSEHLLGEQETNLRELASLRRNVEHIKEIVAMQQNYATFGGVKEMINVADLVEDSLRLNEDAFSRHDVEVVREFETVPPLNLEKHKFLQIMVNLLRNAKHACQDSERADKRLTVRVANGEGRIRISVIDNGVGIPPENLTRIFNYGFTTRKGGHGFGLHSGALAAKEMGGSLTVHSDGPGQGAAFTLELRCLTRENSHE
jgi:PAS domain S-box-containing protein